MMQTAPADPFYTALGLRHWALAFFASVLAMIAATVLLAVAGRPEAVALYVAFSSFCHQQAERTWMFASHPLPVCVRCVGFYLGAFVALVIRARFSMRGLVLAAGFALFTVAAEIGSLWQPPAGVRWLSGLLLGWSLVSPVSAAAAGYGRHTG